MKVYLTLYDECIIIQRGYSTGTRSLFVFPMCIVQMPKTRKYLITTIKWKTIFLLRRDIHENERTPGNAEGARKLRSNRKAEVVDGELSQSIRVRVPRLRAERGNREKPRGTYRRGSPSLDSLQASRSVSARFPNKARTPN